MRKLKLFLSLLMLICFSVGNVWAEDATFDWNATTGNMGSNATGTQGQITLSVAGNSGNTPAVTSGTLRIYAHRSSGDGASATFAAASGYQITAFTIKSSNGGTILKYGIDDATPSTTFTWTNQESTISNLTASSFTIKNCQNSGSSNTTIQIAYVVVTYESTGGSPQPAV